MARLNLDMRRINLYNAFELNDNLRDIKVKIKNAKVIIIDDYSLPVCVLLFANLTHILMLTLVQ